MFRKNVSGQYLYFCLVKASDGTALTGATVTGKRSIDGGAQASVTGTITEDAGGQYHIALSQADINGNDIAFLFTATGAIPVNLQVVTTAADPTNATTFGIGNIDAAVSSRSTYAGADTAGTTTLLTRIPGTVAAQTGDAYARLGAPAGATVSADVAAVKGDTGGLRTDYTTTRAGYLDALNGIVAAIWAYASRTLTAFGFSVTVGTVSDKTGYSLATAPPTAVQVRQEMDSNSAKLANLDATVSSRSTYAGGAVASVTAPVTAGTVSDKTGYSLSVAPPTASDIATAVWAAGTRTLTSFGTLVSDAATAVWSAATRTLTAFGFTVTANADPNVALIKAKTDNLPASPAAVGSAMVASNMVPAPDNASISSIKSKTDNLPSAPAAVGSAMTLTSAYDAAKTAAQSSDVPAASIAAIKAKTDALPGSPAAVGSPMTLTSDYDAAKTAAQGVFPTTEQITDAALKRRIVWNITTQKFDVYNESGTAISFHLSPTMDPTAQPIVGMVAQP